MSKSKFIGLLFRMKYINRWGLMRNTSYENLKEHSFDVAVISHALMVIGKNKLGKSYPEAEVLKYALYHDASEIFTGDMPTPIKYRSENMRSIYKEAEKEATERLLGYLPSEFKNDYKALEEPKNEEIRRLIKASDRIAAIIKCKEEIASGNSEFSDALKSQTEALLKMDLKEAEIFMETYMEGFSLPIDKM